MDWFCNFHLIKAPIPEGAAILDVSYWQYVGSSEEPLWGPSNCTWRCLSPSSSSVVPLWSSLECAPLSTVYIRLHPSSRNLLQAFSESFQTEAENTKKWITLCESLRHNKSNIVLLSMMGLTRPLAVVFQIMDKLISALHVWRFC